MADTAQDRKLPATQRRIEKARDEGQVARSRDLGHFAALGAGVALLAVFAPEVTAWLSRLMADALRATRTCSSATSKPTSLASRRPSRNHEESSAAASRSGTPPGSLGSWQQDAVGVISFDNHRVGDNILNCLRLQADLTA